MLRKILSMLAIIVGMSAYSQGQTYKIGDYYDDGNGVKGYVFEVSGDGHHGKIYGYPRASGRLISLGSKEMIEAGIPEMRNAGGEIMPALMSADLIWAEATSRTDGQANSDKILGKLKEVQSKYGFKYMSGISEVYADLDSRRKLTDNGWYIPAIDELKSLYAAVAQDDFLELMKADFLNNREVRGMSTEQYWKDFVRIPPTAYIWSSTQLNPADKGESNMLVLNLADGHTLYYSPSDFKFWEIFIHKF